MNRSEYRELCKHVVCVGWGLDGVRRVSRQEANGWEMRAEKKALLKPLKNQPPLAVHEHWNTKKCCQLHRTLTTAVSPSSRQSPASTTNRRCDFHPSRPGDVNFHRAASPSRPEKGSVVPRRVGEHRVKLWCNSRHGWGQYCSGAVSVGAGGWTTETARGAALRGTYDVQTRYLFLLRNTLDWFRILNLDFF